MNGPRFGSALAAAVLVSLASQAGAGQCPAERPAAILPTDPALCASLEGSLRHPSALPLDQYEQVVDRYLGGFCHRNQAAGWQPDKRVRDTGPFTAAFDRGRWTGTDHGTHAPVVIWYSPEMLTWLKANRPADGSGPADPPPVPDGAVMVKEMFPAPASLCADVEVTKLLPSSGAALMVRDAAASHDGWFWGWYGFGPGSGWTPDWPPNGGNTLANMGFGLYCTNCHSSARNGLTFANPANVAGEPGEPVNFLSADFFIPGPTASHHRLVGLPTDDPARLGEPLQAFNPALAALAAAGFPKAGWDTVPRLPSETYDNRWVGAGGPTSADEFLTSSQCIGCHDAGSTGLKFDMTRPNPHGDDLLNLSPYATWRTSPMGLGGRDPVFYAQLASETETFHPEAAELVENTCFGCHGVLGQRQLQIDHHRETGACTSFTRADVDLTPWPSGRPGAAGANDERANYGMLARDGISCTACHRMMLGRDATPALASTAENACVAERQALLNPDNTGFARTFTGSFLVGPPDRLLGPFEHPKPRPMAMALGIRPEFDHATASSELCGTCHTVHLPIMAGGDIVGRTYEQTTYPEWAFSAYRTGDSPSGPLPLGAGASAQSCQGCHMPSKDQAGQPLRSKIASIQERSSFPQVENAAAAAEIDLPVREGFALHTLVGLNVFLIKMAQQFPDVLGIRTQDPMMTTLGQDPLLATEQAMLDQASAATATIAVGGLARTATALEATVTVTNETGHKFPSGVGFRRAFVEFDVLDRLDNTIWSSGRTDAAGVIVGADGKPLDGELWWQSDCAARDRPLERLHQPHFQAITSQSQAQIYQELVSTPRPGDKAPQCGPTAAPEGQLTTSFLSICADVKDNRLLPKGFLALDERKSIARALGAQDDLAVDVGATEVGDDPDYRTGGGDSTTYRVPLADLPKGAEPAAVRATLYYQTTPPFYVQDRYCTSQGQDAQRLHFMAGHLNLSGTEAADWKLRLVATGPVPIP